MPVLGMVGQGVSSAMGTTLGTAQTALGFFGQKKALKKLENLHSPTYEKPRSISDYYNQAVNRYQQSPTQSNLYKMQAQNIARGTTQGISALQDRRSAGAGVAALVQNQNDSYLKAAAAAEQDQNQKFSQLGNAAQAMAAEDRMAFNINKMMPYERQYNQLAQKAAAKGQLLNAGLQNMFSGISGGGAAASQVGNMSSFSQAPSSGSSAYSGSEERYLPPSTYKVPLAKIQ
jgi:hypothetical protein